MTSIRRRLLVWLLPPLILAALAADAITFFKAREEMLELLAEMLEASATAAATALAGAGPTAVSPGAVRAIRIWGADGRLLLHAGAPSPPAATAPGAATVRWEGRDWRVLVLERDGRTIQAAEPLAPWERRSTMAAIEVITPFSVAAVPLFAVLIWFGVGRGLQPLTAITAALGTRAAGSLQPMPEAGLPVEVQPLVRALNELLRRLAAALERQRQFVADAAHGLRTPLTAVQLQLENLDRARTPEDRAAAIEQLKAGVPRAVALVQQLLVMARLAPDEAAKRPAAPVALEPLVKDVLMDLHALADRRGIDLGLAHAEPLAVTGDGESLQIMLGNLVENALRYTPPGGVVDVRLFEAGGAAVIEVLDTGPGIPAAERERVFGRFQRGAGVTVPGSGLGLAIVAEVVRQHRGTVALEDRAGGRGLRVTVRLPLDGGAG